jgi:hypothetical protein
MATVHRVDDPLKEAIAKLGSENIALMEKVRIAKDFANIGKAIVGFEGNDKRGKYFQLRVDYDPKKEGHVNVMINDSEKHEYIGKTHDWYLQVLNNINGATYCDVRRDADKLWDASGEEKNPQYINGMKKYMRGLA